MRSLQVILMLTLVGCVAVEEAPMLAQQGALTEDSLQVVRGRRLFQVEDFDGNDRTCATCHVRGTFALGVEQVQDAWSEEGAEHALFRPVDADTEGGDTYSLLRADALVRVRIDLPINVHVVETHSPDVMVLPDGRHRVTLRRATPTSVNSALQDHLMWDGRDGSDLEGQARGAITVHAEPGREPLAGELEAIAAFQRRLFSSPELALYALGGEPPALPEGRTESERRGRTWFLEQPVSQSQETHGFCATCHSGPMLNQTNVFHLGEPVPDLRFAANGTSEANARDLPMLTYEVALPYDLRVPSSPVYPPELHGAIVAPMGTVITYRTPDPGSIVTDSALVGVEQDRVFPGQADPCPSPVPCVNAVMGFAAAPEVFHRIPTLWGIRRTAPYFHDNSAMTLEDTVRHYAAFAAALRLNGLAAAAFAESVGNHELAWFLRDVSEALAIGEQDVIDIAAYMRRL